MLAWILRVCSSDNMAPIYYQISYRFGIKPKMHVQASEHLAIIKSAVPDF